MLSLEFSRKSRFSNYHKSPPDQRAFFIQGCFACSCAGGQNVQFSMINFQVKMNGASVFDLGSTALLPYRD